MPGSCGNGAAVAAAAAAAAFYAHTRKSTRTSLRTLGLTKLCQFYSIRLVALRALYAFCTKPNMPAYGTPMNTSIHS